MIDSLASNHVIERLLAHYKCPPSLIADISQDIYFYLLTHQDRLDYYDSLGCVSQYLSKICKNQLSTHSKSYHLYRKVPVSLDEYPIDCPDLSE